jgi:hypothetical protein
MWKIQMLVQTEDGLDEKVEQVPTPHLHIAIESALYKHGLSNMKTGSVQITAEGS